MEDMSLFANHEKRYIEEKIEQSTRTTYQVCVGDRTFSFSSIRLGYGVPAERQKDYYVFKPERSYNREEPNRKSHNWEL